jgi:ADP-ribosyl-[dinitrogen reductase] hydrolase
MSKRDFIKDSLLGVSVGDAIGVPVEFKSRKWLQEHPVTGVQGYGSHNQPPGTWSDDSSLTFCLAEMLCGKYDLQNLANRFVNWKDHAWWTPYGEVFDIGIGTSEAISRLERGITPVMAGGSGEDSNGNGSLMRILPLLFFVKKQAVIDKRFLAVKDVSSLTHRHIRSVIACFIYLEFALEIMAGKEKREAYRKTCSTIKTFLDETDTCTEKEATHFEKILSGNISHLPEDEIRSSGYVIHTLEASLWCLLNTGNYSGAVLKAINLGEDTDTTAAVTGGLAGLLYGWETIPSEWISGLARREDIEDLSRRLNDKMGS